MITRQTVSILVLVLGALTAAVAGREELAFDLNDVTLTAVAWGRGETVILLPGLGRSSDSYEEFGPKLGERGFRVIALNPRGIRGSTGALTKLSLHDYARDVAQVIRKAGGTPAHVLGWALGNRIARCTANDYPDVVRSVILIAAGGKVPGDAEAGEALAALYRPGLSESDRRRFTSLALFAPGSDPSPYLSLWSPAWSEAREAQSAASQATALDDWWLGGVAPMLVIQGQQDRIAPVANSRLLREGAGPRVELLEVENAGHAVLLEKPDVVLERVVAFLRSHSTGAAK
jgi:pimeloyl-ACP methyl ester carboxylesterase